MKTKNNVMADMFSLGVFDRVMFLQRDNEPFAIIEDPELFERMNYTVVLSLTPDLIDDYKDAGLVEKGAHGDLLVDLEIDGELPKELEEEFDNLGIDPFLLFEDLTGFDYGYGNNFASCSDCGAVIDIYSEVQDYYFGDGFIVCKNCFVVNEYIHDYIENDLINNPTNVTALVDEHILESLGFYKLVEDLDNGYYGQQESPQDIFQILKESYDDIVFKETEKAPYRYRLDVFVRNRDIKQVG